MTWRSSASRCDPRSRRTGTRLIKVLERSAPVSLEPRVLHAMRLSPLLLAATAALLAAAPAYADWPALGASTTIEGSTTGFAEVRVPHAVSLAASDEDSVAHVRLQGTGRLYGVVLRQDDPSTDDPVELMETSGDGDGDPPVTPLWQVGGVPRNGAPVLPAGNYRLSLIADGKPVTAEITFPGLDGTLATAPEVPVPQHLEALPRFDSSGGPLAMFAGEAAPPSRALIVVRPHTTSDLEIDDRSEVCAYGPGEPVDETSFTPGCGDPLWLAEQLAFGDIAGPIIPPGAHEAGYEAWFPEA